MKYEYRGYTIVVDEYGDPDWGFHRFYVYYPHGEMFIHSEAATTIGAKDMAESRVDGEIKHHKEKLWHYVRVIEFEKHEKRNEELSKVG